LVAAGIATCCDDATPQVRAVLASGRAKDVFLKHLAAQGVKEDGVSRFLSSHGKAPRLTVKATHSGTVTAIDVRGISLWLRRLNAASPPANDRVGVEFLKNVGDQVVPGEPLAQVRCSERRLVGAPAISALARHFLLGDSPRDAPQRIIETIRSF